MKPIDGVLIKASILGRVLGMHVLTLDATVVLTPAEVSEPWLEPDLTGRRAPSLSAGRPSGPWHAPNHGLAQAIQRLDESAALLASSRESAPPVGLSPADARRPRTR